MTDCLWIIKVSINKQTNEKWKCATMWCETQHKRAEELIFASNHICSHTPPPPFSPSSTTIYHIHRMRQVVPWRKRRISPDDLCMYTGLNLLTDDMTNIRQALVLFQRLKKEKHQTKTWPPARSKSKSYNLWDNVPPNRGWRCSSSSKMEGKK